MGSYILRIHQAQKLTYKSLVIMQRRTEKRLLHNSIPYAVVAILGHTGSCLDYTKRREQDAIVRKKVMCKIRGSRHISKSKRK